MVTQTSIANQHTIVNGPTRRRRLIGALATVGGALMVIGTLLPWFSLLAGLQSYSGLEGLNGWLLIAGGGASSLAGLVFLVRGTPALRWGIGLLGSG